MERVSFFSTTFVPRAQVFIVVRFYPKLEYVNKIALKLHNTESHQNMLTHFRAVIYGQTDMVRLTGVFFANSFQKHTGYRPTVSTTRHEPVLTAGNCNSVRTGCNCQASYVNSLASLALGS